MATWFFELSLLAQNSCCLIPEIRFRAIILKLYIFHETSQTAKSYRDDVSRTRKKTLATLVFELSPLPKMRVA